MNNLPLFIACGDVFGSDNSFNNTLVKDASCLIFSPEKEEIWISYSFIYLFKRTDEQVIILIIAKFGSFCQNQKSFKSILIKIFKSYFIFEYLKLYI